MTDPGVPPKTGRRGRVPGSKNKRKLYQEYRDRSEKAGRNLALTKDVSVSELVKINGADFIDMSLNAMGEALGFFLHMARKETDDKQRVVYYNDVLQAGVKLAPFRYPTLSSIHTSGEKRSALERTGDVEREVYAEIMAEIVESGELPRAVRAFFTKPTNGSGGSNGGGVSNR